MLIGACSRHCWPALFHRNISSASWHLSPGNDHFFLNLSMAACKAMMDAAANVPFSSMVAVMARNGVNFGIRHFRYWRSLVSRLLPMPLKVCSSPDLALTTLLLTWVIAQLLKPQVWVAHDGVVSGDRQICGRHPCRCHQ
ncbi:DUF1116 domain-containing protein [Escherichia coli]|nr:DUF1116 domain-containing protein [Escherichia coli]